jgi:C1A family cysteine protease
MKAVVLVLCALVAVQALTQNEKAFTEFVAKYNKKYEGVDEFFNRFAIFQENLAMIEAHNAGNHSFTMAANEFTDLTFAEFHAGYTGLLNRPVSPYMRSQNAPEETGLAAPLDSLDWRTKGAVTPIKNQGQCGSCWAFSTTGSVEGVHQISTGTLVSLSEQQLVDCAGSAGNQGCNGGLMDYAFEWIISNKGICTEAAYPYTGVDGRCKTGCAPAATISGYKDVTSGSEAALKTAVSMNPVSVAIEADQSAFQFYSGGVFSAACGTQLDHGVLAVGYGTQGAQNYWIVKNSWGTSWGEAGYIRMVMGKNECGISLAASYPTA